MKRTKPTYRKRDRQTDREERERERERERKRKNEITKLLRSKTEWELKH